MQSGYVAQDLASCTGVSKSTIVRRADKEEWAYTYCEASTKGGRRAKYYAVDALPVDIAAKVLAHEKKAALAQACPLTPEEEQEAALVAQDVVPNGKVPPTAVRVFAEAWVDVLNAWQAELRKIGHGGRKAATKEFSRRYNAGAILTGISREAIPSLSERALYRRWSKYEQSGYDPLALADKRATWIKTSKPKSILTDAMKGLLLAGWLDENQPTKAMAIRTVRDALQGQGCEIIPSDRTMRRWLDEWGDQNNALETLGRKGEKPLVDRCLPFVVRDYSQLEVGDCLVADGHVLNFMIKHPRTGKPARMTLIVFFDWASRMPCGCQIMPTEDSVGISAALLNGCRVLGKYPKSVLLDNGRAFKAKVFTGDVDLTKCGLQSLYGRLGIKTFFTAPYNARAKVVERWFETFGDQFAKLVPSYIGTEISKRPARHNRNEKFMQAEHERRTGNFVPDIRQAAQFIWQYIEWYARQPHEGLEGRTPLEVFEAGQGPGLEWSELYREFLWAKEVTPKQGGVKLFGFLYRADALINFRGKLIAKYDTANLRKIWIYTTDEQFVCEATPVKAVAPLVGLFDDPERRAVEYAEVKSQLKRHRNLKKSVKKQLVELRGKSVIGIADMAEMVGISQSNEMVPLESGQAGPFGPQALPEGRKGVVVEMPERQAEPVKLDTEAMRAEVDARILATRQAEVSYTLPDFMTQADKYSLLWEYKHLENKNLSAEHEKWMAEYEQTDEYDRHCRARMEQLGRAYGVV